MLCVRWVARPVRLKDCCFAQQRPHSVATSHTRKSNKHEKKSHSPRNSYAKYREEKILQQKLLRDDKQTRRAHPYKQLFPWESKMALAKHLQNTEVYNKDGLIALCKPYGVPMVQFEDDEDRQTSKTICTTLNSNNAPPNIPGIHNVLPYLKELYKVKHLEVVKSCERWSSGALLLSTSAAMTDKVTKCIRRSQSFSQPALLYWAVTYGQPQPLSCDIKHVGMKLEYVPSVGKVPVICKKYGANEVKRGEVKKNFVQYSTMKYNKNFDTALVEISTHHRKWHFLRVWLSYCYSPILGDHVYSARVKQLHGKKIQISPHNISASDLLVHPATLLTKLQLPPRAVEQIPCHLHLHTIKLNQYNKDNSDLNITVQPPEHFLWTCKQLDLSNTAEEETLESQQANG